MDDQNTVVSAETSRKDFLKTSAIVGASVAAAATGLEAVAGVASAARVEIVSQAPATTITIYRGNPNGADWVGNLITKYMKANPSIKVVTQFSPQSSTDAHNLFITQLAGGSSAIDLYQVDVIWPPEFANAGWITAIDKYVPANYRSTLMPGPILGTVVRGKQYAFPFFTDAGVLYYRTDLLAKYNLAAPKTWNDLVTSAQKVMAGEKKGMSGKPLNGFVWQGAQYEGLVCDFAEDVWGNGGDILKNFSGAVNVNTPKAVQALQFMMDTINKYKISPPGVITYMEEDSRHIFDNGDAVFMRNWPYAWSLSQAKGSPVAGKIGMIPMVHGPQGSHGAACLGGWNLALNANSKNPQAAANLALYLTSHDSGKYLSINASLSPVLRSVYSDPAVLAVNPWYKFFYPVALNAYPRPVSPLYSRLSNSIQIDVHAALAGQMSAGKALSKLQADLDSVVSNAF